MRRIDQILPTIVYGDAVSNDAIAIMNLLRGFGYKSDIFAENIGNNINEQIKYVKDYKIHDSKDILIYHMSTGSELSSKMQEFTKGIKVMIYHNITPSEFLCSFNTECSSLVDSGRKQLKELSSTFDYAIADSEYNRLELEAFNYKNTRVMPIIIPFKDFEKEADKNLLSKYSDGKVNFLFVGRIAPNKKQEDIIKSFYYYKKYFNKDSRLFLVGSYEGMERYFNVLKLLVEKLELEDVYFTGKTSFSEMLAYYKTANAFICMSEHEGFCVPLIESMYFNVPIIAYESSAIPYTMENSGIIVKEKDYKLIAGLLDKVVKDERVKELLVSGQRKRLQFFSSENSKIYLKNILNEIIGDNNE